MTITHTIRAEIEVRFVPVSLVEIEVAYPTVDIDFTYSPGRPETGPTYACGGTPAEPADVEMTKATLVNGDGLLPTQAQIDDWAENWLDGDGYERALDVACAKEDA